MILEIISVTNYKVLKKKINVLVEVALRDLLN